MPDIGKLRIWTPINLANQNEVKEHPIVARLQKFRQGWLDIRNRFGISLLSAQVKAPKTVEVGTFESRMRKCLSLVSADLDHMKSEDLNNGGFHRDAYDNRRAALDAMGKLATAASADGMPPRIFKERLEDQMKGLRANQLQQLRKNAAVLFANVAVGEGAGNLDMVKERKAILDFIHEICNQRLIEKGYGSLPSLIEAD